MHEIPRGGGHLSRFACLLFTVVPGLLCVLLLLSCGASAAAVPSRSPEPYEVVQSLLDRLKACHESFRQEIEASRTDSEAVAALDRLTAEYLPLLDELDAICVGYPELDTAARNRDLSPRQRELAAQVDSARLEVNRLFDILGQDRFCTSGPVLDALGRFLETQGVPYPGF